MHSHSPEPIWLSLSPSRHLRRTLLLLHGLAMLSLLWLQLPLLIRLAGMALLGASLAGYWRRYAWLKGAGAVRRLHWRADGDCWLTDGSGRVSVYREVRAGLLQPGLVVLRLSGKGTDRWVALADDCADAQALRRLRVRLRRSPPQDDQGKPLRGR